RFNSITWAVDVDEVFALGPATIDPRTGEILHSGIVFTSGWIRSWSAGFEIYGDSPESPSSRHRSLLSGSRHSHQHGHSHAHAQHGHDGHSHFHLHSHSHSHSHSPLGDGGDGAAAEGGDSGKGGGMGVLEKLLPSLGGGGRSRHGGSGSLRYHGRGACQEVRRDNVATSIL
ncbi:unnamed protein product, partial [Hapterophycus canaliculatus]